MKPTFGHHIFINCWLGGREGIRPVKNWVVGCCRGCLGWGADLHIAQQMPLPLTVSCSSKSRLALTFLVLPFWYLLTRVVPDIFQKSSKTVVCVFIPQKISKVKTSNIRGVEEVQAYFLQLRLKMSIGKYYKRSQTSVQLLSQWLGS